LCGAARLKLLIRETRVNKVKTNKVRAKLSRRSRTPTASTADERFAPPD
jgi:hypothetical protein